MVEARKMNSFLVDDFVGEEDDCEEIDYEVNLAVL